MRATVTPPYVPRKRVNMRPYYLTLLIAQVLFDFYVILKVLVPLG